MLWGAQNYKPVFQAFLNDSASMDYISTNPPIVRFHLSEGLSELDFA